REMISQIELYDCRTRFYSQALGRFLQTDLIRFNAADVNLYRYCFNNAVNVVDPLGLRRCLTDKEKKKLKALLDKLKDLAKKLGDNDLLNALNALDVKGILEKSDLGPDLSSDESYTELNDYFGGLFTTNGGTYLSEDFFRRTDVEAQSTTLIHE